MKIHNKFIAKMGAEASSRPDLLARIDLDELSFDLRNAAATETSQQRKADALKRLSVVEAFRDANTQN
jgi:DNA-directed RNA polymerase subunit beta'